jgi:hypothetical protein
VIKADVVSPGVQGSATFPQTTEVEEAKLAAGDPTEDVAAIAQASDIPKTPPIQAGVVPPGAQGPASALPQTTDVGDVNLAAGDPIEDKAASAQVGAAAMELVDTAAANASVEATAAQATAAMENVQVQLTLTQVQKQASPEVPLDPLAKEVQPESTAKEKAPAATIYMATLVATLRTMQHGMEQTMQDAVQSMEERVTRKQRTVFPKVGAKIVSMGTGLQALANNAHESHLVVQDLQRKMEEQEHSAWAP